MSKKFTFPVGVPDPGASTVIVALIAGLWPNTLGLTVDVTASVVFALFTVYGFIDPDDVL